LARPDSVNTIITTRADTLARPDGVNTMITMIPCRGRPMCRPATMTANTTAINDQQRHSNDDSLS
jgi:hypothetical protein